MSFEVTAVCDMCGSDWWTSCSDASPAFASRGDALRSLPADYGWRIDEQTDGSLRMLCQLCALLEDCATNGHTWVDLEYTLDGELQKYGEVCGHCSVVRGGDTPAGDHPESLALELSPAEEELLGEIEAEEFPEDDRTFAAGVRAALARLRQNGTIR